MQWLKAMISAVTGIFKSAVPKPEQSRQQIHEFGNEEEGETPAPRSRQQIHGDEL